MLKLVWQTKSAFLYECFKNERLGSRANGGNAYDYSAYIALKEKYLIKPDVETIYRSDDNYLSYMWRLCNTR